MKGRVESIDLATFKEFVRTAGKLLEARREELNAMNVFPVPDGDTGVNMWFTIRSVVDGVEETSSFDQFMHTMVHRALLGARGNSGVILAQFLEGFVQSLDQNSCIDPGNLAAALRGGVEAAYRAVGSPVEGTILTVMRAVAEEASMIKSSDMGRISRRLLAAARRAERQTPELLPILKAAGVRDAGGEGFVAILEALNAVLTHKELKLKPPRRVEHRADVWFKGPSFRYCLEFVIEDDGIELSDLRQTLGSWGDSVLLARGEGMVRVHIHTNQPEEVKGIGERLGRVSGVKVDDMVVQHRSFLFAPRVGVVAVAEGRGIDRIFRSLGATVVRGHGTMNPSVEELLQVLARMETPEALVLPNDPNVILAAERAVGLAHISAQVVPTRSIPEGISALVVFDPEGDMGENSRGMAEVVKGVRSGRVARAIRDGEYGKIRVKRGEYIGLGDGMALSSSPSPEGATLQLIKELLSPESQLVMLYYGAGVKRRLAESLEREVREAYPGLEVQVYYGGQPNYSYLVGVS